MPDLAGWRKTRMPHRPDTAYFPLAPDWVCEILSPSTAVVDRVKKLPVYAREGVANAWLIDPALQTLEVLRLDGGNWVLLGTHADGDVVRAEPFIELGLELRLLWAEPEDASS